MLAMLSDSVDINTDQERENILCQINTRIRRKDVGISNKFRKDNWTVT